MVKQNTFSLYGGFFNTTKILCCIVLAFTTLSLTACMKTGEEKINTELFKDIDDLKAKTADLKPGMKKKAVFKNLGIPVSKFQRMSREEIQINVYGLSQVNGTPNELEEFRKRLSSYDGYILPYRSLKSDSSLGFGKMKMKKSGPDLRVVIIFKHNKLLRASVVGSEYTEVNQDQYLWGSLIRKGIGLAF